MDNFPIYTTLVFLGYLYSNQPSATWVPAAMILILVLLIVSDILQIKKLKRQ